MRRGVIMTLLFLLPMLSSAQDVIYEKNDSMTIERILHKHSGNRHIDTGGLLLAVADEFIGCKYVPNTLDGHDGEPLYISCTRLDCTTFVELVVAIAISIKEEKANFVTVCHNLERLRYRNGRRDEYASRLHYISWWITDNTGLGILEEVTTATTHKQQKLKLNFMSTHPESYAMLRNDTAMQARIASLEMPFRNINVPYIPKELLNDNRESMDIEDGDIVALVTNIDGLDVSHIGFAFWQDGKLHLLHASSGEGKVIRDHTTLFSYQMGKSRQTGIRVIRIKD